MEIALAPVDNVLLANLCGPLDENIRQIETGLDVTIRRRNERFSISGEKAQLTVDAIRHFYGMARQAISVDEIQLGLIELTNAPVRRISRKAGCRFRMQQRRPQPHCCWRNCQSRKVGRCACSMPAQPRVARPRTCWNMQRPAALK